MKKLKRSYIFWVLSITIILLPAFSFAQNENFCYDKESWGEWNKLARKYPQDMDVQMLHAVRIGFCKKIEEGTISFEMANDIFNQLHESVIKKSKEQQEQYKKDLQL